MNVFTPLRQSPTPWVWLRTGRIEPSRGRVVSSLQVQYTPLAGGAAARRSFSPRNPGYTAALPGLHRAITRRQGQEAMIVPRTTHGHVTALTLGHTKRSGHERQHGTLNKGGWMERTRQQNRPPQGMERPAPFLLWTTLLKAFICSAVLRLIYSGVSIT